MSPMKLCGRSRMQPAMVGELVPDRRSIHCRLQVFFGPLGEANSPFGPN
jgi:hypothetical protein